MPETAANHPAASRRSADHTMAMKWLVVLAAMTVATVLDGIAVSEMSKPGIDAMPVGEQAAITLPSDRCEPGCAIMVASNQPSSVAGDRIQ